MSDYAELIGRVLGGNGQPPPGDDDVPLPEPPDADDRPASGEGELVTRPLSAVKPELVRWLWKGRIPLGKLTAIGGEPGAGKSYITMALASAISRGVDLAEADVPDAGQRTQPADVLLASYEDEAEDTLRPRAEALGADLDRVHEIQGLREADGTIRPFGASDVPRLELKLASLQRPRLLVIDPIGAWVGAGVDVYRDNEVRAALEGLRRLAADLRVAVLLVMHLRKAVAHNALARFSGSGAFAHPTEEATPS